MPNKPTKKDRREASKQARFEAEQRSRKQHRMRLVYGGIGSAAVIGLIVALVLASGSTKLNLVALNRAATAAGCSALQAVPDQGRSHIQPPATFNYNSNPPTSGNHYSISGTAPAPTGVYQAPIQSEIQVHNLEHGHIGIQYSQGTLSASVRDQLETFTRNHDTWIFMAPRQLDAGVVLAFTRWDNKVTCTSPTDASAVVAFAQTFYDDFHGLGPEGALPGTPKSGG